MTLDVEEVTHAIADLRTSEQSRSTVFDKAWESGFQDGIDAAMNAVQELIDEKGERAE